MTTDFKIDEIVILKNNEERRKRESNFRKYNSRRTGERKNSGNTSSKQPTRRNSRRIKTDTKPTYSTRKTGFVRRTHRRNRSRNPKSTELCE